MLLVKKEALLQLAFVFAFFSAFFSLSYAFDTSQPWHPVQQIATDSAGTKSVDDNGNGIVDSSEGLSCEKCINHTHIANNSIANDHLTKNSVTSYNIVDGTIQKEDLGFSISSGSSNAESCTGDDVCELSNGYISGNLSIGTTDKSERLVVNGNIKPAMNWSYDVGSSSSLWRSVYSLYGYFSSVFLNSKELSESGGRLYFNNRLLVNEDDKLGNSTEEIRDAVNNSGYYNISTSWTMLTDIPADIANGDDDYCSQGICNGNLYVDGNLSVTGKTYQVNTVSTNGSLVVNYSFKAGAFSGSGFVVDANGNIYSEGNALNIKDNASVSGNLSVGNNLVIGSNITTASGASWLKLSGCTDNSYVQSVKADGTIVCAEESGKGNSTEEIRNAINNSSYYNISTSWTRLTDIPEDIANGDDTKIGIGYLYNDTGYMYLNETMLNNTIDIRAQRFGRRGLGYLYNDSTAIYLNESMLNATIDLRERWNTTEDMQRAAGWNNSNGNVVLFNGFANVGIGTKTPGSKLEVNGSINATSFCLGSDCRASWPRELPQNSVIFYYGTSCPDGYEEVTDARGRVIVGMPLSGTLAGTVGTALSNLATKNITDVPEHYHSIDPPSTATTTEGSHYHSIDPPSTATTTGGSHYHSVDPPSTATTTGGSHYHSIDPPSTATSTAGSHTHSVSHNAPTRTVNADAASGSGSWYFTGTNAGSISIGYAGSHSHTVDIAAFNSGYAGSHSHTVDIAAFNSGYAGSHSHTVDIAAFNSGTSGSHSHTVDIASFNSGTTGIKSVDVSMPYIQLLVCKKVASSGSSSASEGWDFNGNNVYLANSSNNVGIGTAAPEQKLDVQGDIEVGTGTTGCVYDEDGTVIAGTCSSDLRLKKDIRPLTNVLDNISKLQPVSFKWKNSSTKKTQLGLVAQDVRKYLPELVEEDENGYLRVGYDSRLMMYMLESIKELKEENDMLKQNNRVLSKKLIVLQNELCEDKNYSWCKKS